MCIIFILKNYLVLKKHIEKALGMLESYISSGLFGGSLIAASRVVH